ncbi:MAG: Hsp20/alpha crystallin family protein [Nitrospirota bacterium]
MKIIKWDPFKEMMMVEDFFDSMSIMDKKEKQSTWSPAVDVYETEKDMVLTAELPGVRQEDMSLTVFENVLTLRGDRNFGRDVKQENFYRIERNYGHFCRRFSMPCEVDTSRISAVFNDGVLKVVIPKATQHGKKVHVKIKPESS